MNRTVPKLGLGFWFLGILSAGILAAGQGADLCRGEQEAEAIRCLADELRPELRDHFHCSCIFRELTRSRNEVESAARSVRAAARSRSRICELPREVACLTESVNRLQCLVDRARGYRRDFGSQGLDYGCVSRVERLLAEMCRRATLLEAFAGGNQFGGSYEGDWIHGDWRDASNFNPAMVVPGPYGDRGAVFQTQAGFSSFTPVLIPPVTDRRVQFGREVARSRSVTRSRELRDR